MINNYTKNSDRLMDEIVDQPDGLTPEEKAIIEDKFQ